VIKHGLNIKLCLVINETHYQNESHKHYNRNTIYKQFYCTNMHVLLPSSIIFPLGILLLHVSPREEPVIEKWVRGIVLSHLQLQEPTNYVT